MHKHTSPWGRQEGLVSIVVTMLLMVIVSLIVLGFARNARREQRQVLDRQLSTQAFYAAESGVNDAVKALKTLLPSNPAPEKDVCGTDTDFPMTGITSSLDTSGASYTCLLVTTKQDSLDYGSVDTTARVIPIKADAAAAVNSITISWQGKETDDLTGCSGATSQPVVGSWNCPAGLLRLDVVPIGDGTNLSRNNLVNNTMTAFVYPNNSAGAMTTLDYATARGFQNQGQKLAVRCGTLTPSAAYRCALQITNLPASNNQFQLRMQSFYKASRSNVKAADGAGNPVKLVGAQATIDSTGKASDVLRRIQVRIPLSSSGGITGDFAIQAADDLCKQFRVGAGFYDNNGQACNDPTN